MFTSNETLQVGRHAVGGGGYAWGRPREREPARSVTGGARAQQVPERKPSWCQGECPVGRRSNHVGGRGESESGWGVPSGTLPCKGWEDAKSPGMVGVRTRGQRLTTVPCPEGW